VRETGRKYRGLKVGGYSLAESRRESKKRKESAVGERAVKVRRRIQERKEEETSG
jgi:hypothetical protein